MRNEDFQDLLDYAEGFYAYIAMINGIQNMFSFSDHADRAHRNTITLLKMFYETSDASSEFFDDIDTLIKDIGYVEFKSDLFRQLPNTEDLIDKCRKHQALGEIIYRDKELTPQAVEYILHCSEFPVLCIIEAIDRGTINKKKAQALQDLFRKLYESDDTFQATADQEFSKEAMDYLLNPNCSLFLAPTKVFPIDK